MLFSSAIRPTRLATSVLAACSSTVRTSGAVPVTFWMPLPVAFAVSTVVVTPPPIAPPSTKASKPRSISSSLVYLPPWVAALPAITASCAVSVAPSATVDLMMRLPIAWAAFGFPALISFSTSSCPESLAKSGFGITLPAPNLSRIPTITPVPEATALSYSPVFSSCSKADSPAPIAAEPTKVEPPIKAEAVSENGAVIAARPVPAIAAPPDAAFSADFSAIQPTASLKPPLS